MYIGLFKIYSTLFHLTYGEYKSEPENESMSIRVCKNKYELHHSGNNNMVLAQRCLGDR